MVDNSAQFGTSTFTHMFNDSAIKNTSDRGNGLMMDDLTVDSHDSQNSKSITNNIAGQMPGNKAPVSEAKKETAPIHKEESNKIKNIHNKKHDIVSKIPSIPSEDNRKLEIVNDSKNQQKIVKRFFKLNSKQKKEVIQTIIQRKKNAKTPDEKIYYDKMLKLVK